MSNARTLAAIRKAAPEQDRSSPALSRKEDPQSFRSESTRYVPVDLRPRDLDQLSRMVGPYAEAAGVQAVWGAVSRWLMWQSNNDALSNAIKVASVALVLCVESDAWRLGYPNLSGERDTPVLHTLTLEAHEEARRVGAETIADWERAGSPHLMTAIEYIHKYIHACMRAETERTAA